MASTYHLGSIYKNTNFVTDTLPKRTSKHSLTKKRCTFLLLFIYLPTVAKFPPFEIFFPNFGLKHPGYPRLEKVFKFSLIGGYPANRN